MAPKVGKEFTVKMNDADVVLFFKRPNQEELFEIDLQYRKIYSEALRNGVMTEAEAKKLLKKNNSWGKEDEDRISSLAFDIAQNQRILEGFKDRPKEQILELINKITGLRSDLFDLISQRTSMLTNAAEGIANEQRIHKLIEICLINKATEEPYFADMGQYKEFASSHVDELSQIYRQAWMFEYGATEDSMENYPEIKVLKELVEKEKAEAETAKKEEVPAPVVATE